MKILITMLVSTALLLASQTIKISKQQQNDLGVKNENITAVKSMFIGPYNGIIRLDKKDIISVGSNVDSIIHNIYVRKLENVTKGEKLLTLRSNELLSFQQNYIEALIKRENINKNYERNQKLQTTGIISHKKLLDSLKDKQTNDLRVKLNANRLLTSGFTLEMLKRIQKTHSAIMQINILAPRNGVVNNIDINIGEKVESNRSMMSIYADGKRFIEITIPVKTVEYISIGDFCEFDSYKAKIIAIGNVVKSQSQSVSVMAVIENDKNIMINRIYRVNISKSISDTFKIKKSALVFLKNKAYIFKQMDTGFEVLDAKIIKESSEFYIIKSDLKEGDSLAISSTSALLSAMDN